MHCQEGESLLLMQDVCQGMGLPFNNDDYRISDIAQVRRYHTLSEEQIALHVMMTPSNGNIFRVTDPLCGEFTGFWWIPLKKANDAFIMASL